jgi:hypothetical protein
MLEGVNKCFGIEWRFARGHGCAPFWASGCGCLVGVIEEWRVVGQQLTFLVDELAKEFEGLTWWVRLQVGTDGSLGVSKGPAKVDKLV